MKRAFRVLPSVVLGLALVDRSSFARSASQEGAKPRGTTLTNADVLRMLQAGLGEAVILAAIRKAERRSFTLTPAALIELKAAGASEAVLLALLEGKPAPAATPSAPPPPRSPPSEPANGTSRPTVAIIAGGLAAAGFVLFEALQDGSGEPEAGNHRPERVGVQVMPTGQALVAATRMTFAGLGTDPDGDPLTFTWDLGDGATGAGPVVTHVYESPGTFAVVLAVRDSRGGSATARASVTARTLTGVWDVRSRGQTIGQAQVAQDGAVITGWVTGPRNAFAGRLSDPRHVNLRLLLVNCGQSYGLSGAASERLDAITLRGGPTCYEDPLELDLVR